MPQHTMLLPIPLFLSLAFAAPTPQGFDTALAARSLITCDSIYCDTVEDYGVHHPVDIKPKSTVDCDPGACRTVETMAVATPTLDLDKRALHPIFTPLSVVTPLPIFTPLPHTTLKWPTTSFYCDPSICNPVESIELETPVLDLDKRGLPVTIDLHPIATSFSDLFATPAPFVTHTDPGWIDAVPTIDPLEGLIPIWTDPGWIDPAPSEFASGEELGKRGLHFSDPLPFPDPHPGHPDLDPLEPLDESDDPSPVEHNTDNSQFKHNELSKRGFTHTIPTIPIVSPVLIDGLDDPRPVDLGKEHVLGKRIVNALRKRTQVPEPVPDDGPADGGNGLSKRIYNEFRKRMQGPEPVPDDDPADIGNELARMKRERPSEPFPDPDYQDYDGSLKLKTRTPGQHSGIGGGVGLTHTGTEIGNVVSVDGGGQLRTRMLEELKTRTPGPGQHSGVGGGVGVVESGSGVNNGKTKRAVNTGIGVINGKRVVVDSDQGMGKEVGHWGVGNGRRGVNVGEDKVKRGAGGVGGGTWPGVVAVDEDQSKSKAKRGISGRGGAPPPRREVAAGSGSVVGNGIVIGSKEKLKRSDISVSNQLDQEVDYESDGEAVFTDWKRDAAGITALDGVVATVKGGVVIISKVKERSMPEEMELVERPELESAAADHQAVFADWEW